VSTLTVSLVVSCVKFSIFWSNLRKVYADLRIEMRKFMNFNTVLISKCTFGWFDGLMHDFWFSNVLFSWRISLPACYSNTNSNNNNLYNNHQLLKTRALKRENPKTQGHPKPRSWLELYLGLSRRKDRVYF